MGWASDLADQSSPATTTPATMGTTKATRRRGAMIKSGLFRRGKNLLYRRRRPNPLPLPSDGRVWPRGGRERGRRRRRRRGLKNRLSLAYTGALPGSPPNLAYTTWTTCSGVWINTNCIQPCDIPTKSLLLQVFWLNLVCLVHHQHIGEAPRDQTPRSSCHDTAPGRAKRETPI